MILVLRSKSVLRLNDDPTKLWRYLGSASGASGTREAFALPANLQMDATHGSSVHSFNLDSVYPSGLYGFIVKQCWFFCVQSMRCVGSPSVTPRAVPSNHHLLLTGATSLQRI